MSRAAAGPGARRPSTSQAENPAQGDSATLESMTRRETVLTVQREAIKAAAERNKAESISLFGSVARGDDTKDSDYDFLAKFVKGASLLDLSQLKIDLRELLNADVDVVSEGGLSGSSLRILDEAIPL